MKARFSWLPAAVLIAGAVVTVGINPQRSLPLRASLDETLPSLLHGVRGIDQTISEGEATVAGFTDYLLRLYEPAPDDRGLPPWFSVYVGYYDSQTQGRTIHSPKNCLPGSGWEALTSTAAMIETPAGPVRVNRYVLQREDERALVLYWYQGRGRVESNEYVVKLDLLRDAALRRRSEEALVRVVVPIEESEEEAFAVAMEAARELVPSVFRALPAA